VRHKLFDTHCHLDMDEFQDDLPAVLQRAKEKGVEKFIVPSCGSFNWDKAAVLSRQHRDIYYALGMHPYFTQEHNPDDLVELDNRLASAPTKCIAVGECGLDFFKHDSDEDKQIVLFDAQLELANKHDLPVILHCRKAHQEMIKRLKQTKVARTGVIHAFSGSYEQAMDFIKLGYYIGVGSTITYFRAKKTRETVSKLPLEYLVLETDAPDMPLSGYQGQRNVPERVLNVLNELIVLRSEPEQTVAEQVFKNSHFLFSIFK